MIIRVSRRTVLVGGLAAALAGCAGRAAAPPAAPPPGPVTADPTAALVELERRSGRRITLVARDTGTGREVRHRADERALMASTVKVLIVAAVLRRRLAEPGLLERTIRYTRADLLEYAPTTSRNVDTGMTVAALCEAAIVVSDNTAANLLTALVGGPAATTAFVRTLGDPVTRADRPEPGLNETAPGDERDTTTAAAMAGDLQALVLGEALDPAGRDLLAGWMVGAVTGTEQIRAGLPRDWRVGDKTGSGAQGENNDVAVVWPPGRAPWVITVYTSPAEPASTNGRPTVAEATRIAAAGL
ncbi:class A beta-lactamase [Actinomycetospora lemnae]|uniref:Beta-lactamase n=1 Tax=Actinomycetospora lemnae TaxID=3019891 RepID=A0ABT5SYB4_9PSEU|nr:class A beta-lactamase [Actinomycetospora sp. DW7H6]MDD7967858.1 class A beta-lactamase [Actinomycetospora sp. DW7H6]